MIFGTAAYSHDSHLLQLSEHYLGTAVTKFHFPSSPWRQTVVTEALLPLGPTMVPVTSKFPFWFIVPFAAFSLKWLRRAGSMVSSSKPITPRKKPPFPALPTLLGTFPRR